MTPKDGITTLTDAQLEAMLDRAAKRGAREALREIGLGDENAHLDVRDLRGLIVAIRDTKRTIRLQITKMIVTILLVAMAGGMAAAILKYGAEK